MSIYEEALKFKKRYRNTISFRIKQHCKILENFINDDEEVIYVFTGQRNDNYFDIITSCAIALTNKRIIIGQKRLLWGYFYTTITPELFNDLKVSTGLFWGKIYIDTAKELVVISNLDKSSLDEIETAITKFMMNEKKKYQIVKEN